MRGAIDLDLEDLSDAVLETLQKRERRTMPKQQPHKSRQTYRTEAAFIDAVVARFGPITFDLAAEPETAWAKHFYSKEDSAFDHDWTSPEHGNHLWLNPPFDSIGRFANKCAATIFEAAYKKANEPHIAISLLVPASIGSNWYRDHVYPYAKTIALCGRLCFDGIDAYPKDCMLCRFEVPDMFDACRLELWDWRKK